MFDRHLLVLNPKVPALAPLLDCAQVTLPEILSFPYVALSESMPMGRAMAERARALGLAYEPIVEMPSFALLLDIVLQGAGAAVVPRSAFDRFPRKPELETVPIGEPWAFRPLAFALPKTSNGSEGSDSGGSVGSTGHGSSPLARAFVALALEMLRDGHGRGLGAADAPN